MDKDTEQEIAKGLQEGDRLAWLQLYETYAERVWQNVARLMGYDCQGVPDVMQETFLAASRSAKNFDPRRGSLWIWLWGKWSSLSSSVNCLRQADVLIGKGKAVPEVCKEIEISQQTYYRWRQKYGGMSPDMIKQLRAVQKENAQLRKLVADQALDISILKVAAEGNF